ncbi:MAG TPA: hypothetical protein VET89_01585 [Stellaceae bacterium]|jgi:hypothetical protein|nr:hypothetical protein [Stellaceae bacterium]
MEVRPATLVKTGLWIIAIGWAPVVVIGLMDPTSHPAGLAIIAWFGTMLGAGLFVGGCGFGLFRNVGKRRRRRF